MIYAHFCGSWGHYTCLSWLPTYFRCSGSHCVKFMLYMPWRCWILICILCSEELNLNLTEAAWVRLKEVFAESISDMYYNHSVIEEIFFLPTQHSWNICFDMSMNLVVYQMLFGNVSLHMVTAVFGKRNLDLLLLCKDNFVVWSLGLH